MRRCTVLLKHTIHAVVLLQLGYEKVLQHVQVRSWSNCFLAKYEWPIQFIATYPAPDMDFRTNSFQLIGDMRIFSSPYDCTDITLSNLANDNTHLAFCLAVNGILFIQTFLSNFFCFLMRYQTPVFFFYIIFSPKTILYHSYRKFYSDFILCLPKRITLYIKVIIFYKT